MVYSINFTKKAVKELEKINEPHYSSIRNAIRNLGVNPRPNGYKKLRGRDGYRIRVGDYRVIYDISDTILFIEVIDLGHRKNIYD
jgi:mRNA interferase RelE/StbE